MAPPRFTTLEQDRRPAMKDLPEANPSARFFQLVLLTAATFAATYGRFTLGPLQETMRVSFGLSDNQVALLQGAAMAIPMALGSIPVGLLVDRYSRARLFVVFAILTTVAAALSAFAPNLIVLFMARSLAGLASAAMLVLSFSVLSDLYAPAQRGRATMVTFFGEIGGAPAAFALGGLLLALSSAAAGTGSENWRWALAWMCAPLVLVAILMLFLREPKRTGITEHDLPMRAAWASLWRYRGVVVPLLLARIMVWVADGGVLVWGAPTFARRFNLPPDRVGTIMASALLIAGIMGPLLGGPLADLCQRTGGPRRTMAGLCVVALLSIPAALFATVSAPTMSSFLLGAFLTFGFTIGTAALALATIVIPGELRGLYLAVTISVGATFSIGIAPLVVSSVSGALGGPAHIGEALTLICVATSILGAIVFGLGGRYYPGGGVAHVPQSSHLGSVSHRLGAEHAGQ